MQKYIKLIEYVCHDFSSALSLAAGQISNSVERRSIREILYPSVTMCPRYYGEGANVANFTEAAAAVKKKGSSMLQLLHHIVEGE